LTSDGNAARSSAALVAGYLAVTAISLWRIARVRSLRALLSEIPERNGRERERERETEKKRERNGRNSRSLLSAAFASMH